jgi:2-polyprenyl-3-methyl-5-hydroxy-6-metoxy-1,4-benzoquinol methylase
MTMTDQDSPATTEAEATNQRGYALAERLLGSLIGGMELLTVHLGQRLGLYVALHSGGPATAAELAQRAGIAERYAREWLEQQAAAGFIEVAQETGHSHTRRFALPAAHVGVFVDADDPTYLVGAADMLVGSALPLPAVEAAYRTGAGVEYAAYGAEMRHGIAALNRPMFGADLPGWLATMPDVTARLRSGGRVLDAGCGVGWSTITIARAFPQARVHGVDMDEASIAEARQNAAAAGVADRVTFEAANATSIGATGFDLVCSFEALHDMGEPIEALRQLRSALAPGAPVLIADERVADEFTAPAEEIERLQYAFSVVHCLPATMAESTAVANGTVLRAPTVRAWAEQAGFSAVEVLPIENDFWRFYRLDR